MQQLSLSPKAILSTRDFPVHNEHVLRMYFHIARYAPESIPATPVLEKKTFLEYAQGDISDLLLLEYLQTREDITHILLDGSHKTTALTLINKAIPVVIIEQDCDLDEMRKGVAEGVYFSFAPSQRTIAQLVHDTICHAIYRAENDDMLSVFEKTKKMIDERVLPEYIQNYYNRKHKTE